MQQVEFVVPRISHDEYTYALVKAYVPEDKKKLHTPMGFMNTVVQAVTDWILGSDAGHEAWEGSSFDFNVGDLAHHQYNTALITALQLHGIFNLSVACSVNYPHNWRYDVRLVDERRLKE